MEHELGWRRADLEEQLNLPWEWLSAHYQHLEGWQINKNKFTEDKYLYELGREFGPITIPHRYR